MGTDLKKSNLPFFKREKSLDMVEGFRPRPAHHVKVKKWFEYPPAQNIEKLRWRNAL